jgi:hypothetical protein
MSFNVLLVSEFGWLKQKSRIARNRDRGSLVRTPHFAQCDLVNIAK